MSLFAGLAGGVNAVRPGRTTMPGVDIALVICVIAMGLFGLLMVYSASIALADGPRYESYGRYYFVIRHGIFLALGVLTMLLAFNVPMDTWRRAAVPLFIVTVILLCVVLIPGVGREVNGARRWLSLGIVNFQPSELMKVAIVLFAADYTTSRGEHMRSFLRGFMPMAIALAVVGATLLLEPDLGAFMVIVAIAVGILFIGGLSGKLFSGILLFLITSFLLLIWLSPWRRERLFVYLDPWNPENTYGSAYQLSHSLIALGRGEWFGVGLGASVEKLHYLPEAHTDFIVAVIGEELGFVGVMALLALFAFLVWRGFEIARQAVAMDRIFSSMVAQGVVIWFGVQAFINVGVCVGLLPTKGLTLPLVSYGGSSIVMNCLALALLLRVDHENRNLMRGKRS